MSHFRWWLQLYWLYPPPLPLFRRWTWRAWRATSRASWACPTAESSTAASLKSSSAGSQLCDSSFSLVVYLHFLCLSRPALLWPHPLSAAWEHIPGACARHPPPSPCHHFPNLPIWSYNFRMNDKRTVSTQQLFFFFYCNSELLNPKPWPFWNL